MPRRNPNQLLHVTEKLTFKVKLTLTALFYLVKFVLRWMQTSLLVLSMIFAPSAFAVQIQTGEALQFQSLANGRDQIGVLRAGSIVDIPDQFRVNDRNGKFSSELTLNNWLKNAGQLGASQPNHGGGILREGERATDYFFPVKIVSAAPGSKLPTTNGKTYFLALRWLARNKNQQLVVQQDAPVKVQPQISAPMEAQCTEGTCLPKERSHSPALDRLVTDLAPALQRAQVGATHNRRRTSNDMRTLAHEFQRTCGFSLESFIPIVKNRAQAAGVPTNILLSIMVQESSGHCFGYNSNGHTADRGLFGINSGSSNIRACSRTEVRQIRSSTAAQLATGPQCIENPVVYLDASIRILKSKLKSIISSGFEYRKLHDSTGRPTADAWRLAVSAYNGGERWVKRAKTDLEEFNRKQGTHLDPNNWEDLRVFYLRSFLDQNRESRHFGGRTSGRTSTAILNLAYTENVVPRRRSTTQEHPTIAELWSRRSTSSN